MLASLFRALAVVLVSCCSPRPPWRWTAMPSPSPITICNSPSIRTSRLSPSKARSSCATLSSQPQREVALQISSSLHWLSVLAGGAPVEWLAQSYTSDIDHTGLLSEAIVKLDTPLAPGATIVLNVRYSGTVLKDATRLERIGTPRRDRAAQRLG